jgi:hypothetical protein
LTEERETGLAGKWAGGDEIPWEKTSMCGFVGARCGRRRGLDRGPILNAAARWSTAIGKPMRNQMGIMRHRYLRISIRRFHRIAM